LSQVLVLSLLWMVNQLAILSKNGSVFEKDI